MRVKNDTPLGYCQCGCGGKTAINKWSRPSRGIKKGEPSKFVSGHNGRKRVEDQYSRDPDGCWVWRGEMSNVGYGVVRLPNSRKTRVAHRVVYEMVIGPIPDGLQLDHLCRNRACVNPDHLEPVTQRENIYRGDATRLTDADIRAIRASGDSNASVAERFGVTKQHIASIRTGRVRREVVH